MFVKYFEGSSDHEDSTHTKFEACYSEEVVGGEHSTKILKYCLLSD